MVNPIQIDPEIMHGTPCFAGTRVPVKILFDVLEKGRDIDDFLSGFPTVTREQAVEVLQIARQRIIETASAPLSAA